MASKEITTKQLSQQIDTLASRLDEFIMFSLEHVATKEDLNGFATKEDLNGFATKEDLNGFATKEDLKAFATKEELYKEMNVQKLDIIDRMDDKFADMKGELIALHKNSDKKFNSLIEILRKRKGISKQEAMRLLGYSYSRTAR